MDVVKYGSFVGSVRERTLDMRRLASWLLTGSLLTGSLFTGSLLVGCQGSAAGAVMENNGRGPFLTGTGELVTNRVNNARTGANLREEVLSPQNAAGLALSNRFLIDGDVFAQVLVADGVRIRQISRPVAIVATMNNSLFAFDMDGSAPGEPLWTRGGEDEDLGAPGQSDFGIVGDHGILSTPVVDTSRSRVLVVVRACDPTLRQACNYRLHEIDIRAGDTRTERLISGRTQVGSEELQFDANAHWNRPALLLHETGLFVAFGAGAEREDSDDPDAPSGDSASSSGAAGQGWIFRYDPEDINIGPQVYVTGSMNAAASTAQAGSSIAQAGAGPAADDEFLYVTAGPSTPESTDGGRVIRLSLDGFQRSNVSSEPGANRSDASAVVYRAPGTSSLSSAETIWELSGGTSGVTLIPETDHLLTSVSPGLIHVLSRSALEETQEPLAPFGDDSEATLLQGMVFWRPNEAGVEGPGNFGYAYVWPNRQRLTSFRFDYQTGMLEVLATAELPALRDGGNLMLTAQGGVAETGVLWATTERPPAETTLMGNRPGRVWAFDPFSLETLWYADTPGFSRFNPPTVVRGRVLVASTSGDDAEEQSVLMYAVRRPTMLVPDTGLR